MARMTVVRGEGLAMTFETETVECALIAKAFRATERDQLQGSGESSSQNCAWILRIRSRPCAAELWRRTNRQGGCECPVGIDE